MTVAWCRNNPTTDLVVVSALNAEPLSNPRKATKVEVDVSRQIIFASNEDMSLRGKDECKVDSRCLTNATTTRRIDAHDGSHQRNACQTTR